MLSYDLKLVQFGDDGKSSPCTVQLTDVVDEFDDSFLAIVTDCVRIFQMLDPDPVSYFYLHCFCGMNTTLAPLTLYLFLSLLSPLDEMTHRVSFGVFLGIVA